jgi:hypothetical protein
MTPKSMRLIIALLCPMSALMRAARQRGGHYKQKLRLGGREY